MITLGYLCGNFWKAYSWDWLMCLSEEYQIYRRSGMTLPNIAYILSRWARQRNTILNTTRRAKRCLSVGSLGFCTSCTVWAVAPVAHCQVLEYVICSFYAISLPATSALFFFRVKAVYSDSKIVTLFFGALWFLVALLSILLMLAVKSSEYIHVLGWISDKLHIPTGHIPFTTRCHESIVKEYVSVPTIITAVYDTLVFLAISWRVISYTVEGYTWQARSRSFFKGTGLHSVSKALLRAGQLYYW